MGKFPAPCVLWPEATCIAAVVLLQLGPSPVRIISVLLLMAWALTSAHGIVQSLSISVLVVEANTGLIAVAPQINLLKWVLILACLVRLTLSSRRNARIRPAWSQWFFIFIGVTAILVLFVSYDRVLSSFKLASFAAGALVALLGVTVDRRPLSYWLNWFFTVHCVVVCLSIPLLFHPAGYWLKGYFQGVFSHPQSFAVYLAFWDSYLIAYLLTERRVNLFLLLLAGVTSYFIFASHCRTAVLAIAVSTILSGLSALFLRRGDLNNVHLRTAVRLCTIALLAVGMIAYDSSRVAAALTDFAIKKYRGGESNLMGLLFASIEGTRGKQVSHLIESIAGHPLLGVGFGLAPIGVQQVVYHDPILGLPVSAPIEQGFLPLGVTAQIGFIGALFLGVFLFKLAAPVAVLAPLPVFATFSTALLLNLGEMFFFATGNLGLQMWLILGLCHECATSAGRLVRNWNPHQVVPGLEVRARRPTATYAR